MHYTSLSGRAFSESYGIQNGLVIDIGGRNVNLSEAGVSPVIHRLPRG